MEQKRSQPCLVFGQKPEPEEIHHLQLHGNTNRKCKKYGWKLHKEAKPSHSTCPLVSWWISKHRLSSRFSRLTSVNVPSSTKFAKSKSNGDPRLLAGATRASDLRPISIYSCWWRIWPHARLKDDNISTFCHQVLPVDPTPPAVRR